MPKERQIELSEVNKQLDSDKEEYIQRCEENYFSQIRQVTDRIITDNVLFVLLAGPSSSGKTTTAERICEKLKNLGRPATRISLDDFYIDRDVLPRLPDGTQDLESIEAIHVEHLRECLKRFEQDGKAEFPIFDFITEKRTEKGRMIRKEDGHVLVVEGIHALNPQITEDFNGTAFLKVFISVASEYVDQNKVLLNRYDIRLVRRMVRDIRHRGADVQETLSMWPSVREGELRNISPFKPFADIRIDSILDYEPGMFRRTLLPLLGTVEEGSPYYRKLHQLYEVFRQFHYLPAECLPKNSLLNEFLWN